MHKSASTASKREPARPTGAGLARPAEASSSASERLSFSKLSRHSYSSAAIDSVRLKPELPPKHLSPFEVVPPKPKPRNQQPTKQASLPHPFSLSLRPAIKLRAEAMAAGRPQETKLGTETATLRELKQRVESRTDEQSQITSKLLEQMRAKEQNHLKKSELSQRHLSAMFGKLDRAAGGLRLDRRRGEQ